MGGVLYELLTGEQPFRSETVPEKVALVLTNTPDFDRVPPKLRRLLESSLERLRLRHIGDVSRLLDAGLPARPEGGFQAPWVLLGSSEYRERASNRRSEVCELTSISLSVPGLKACC
jgi:hypothetical protein